MARFQALVVFSGTDADASGEFFAVRGRRWIESQTESGLLDLLQEALLDGLSAAGTMAEIDLLADAGQIAWRSGMAYAREASPIAASIIGHVGERLASADLEFYPEAARAVRLASPGNPVRARYGNPPTVVVMEVPVPGGLLMIRRGLADGYGRLALPGGHQEPGETWQQAGVREVLEETGLAIDPAFVRIRDAVTVPSGHNLLFARYGKEAGAFEPRTDGETLEVLAVDRPVETAFPTHTAAVQAFFSERPGII